MKQRNDKEKIKQLIESACEYFLMDINDMKGHHRQRDKVENRFMVWKHLYDMGTFTKTFIGQQFSGRDHTSIIHGIITMENLIYTDSQIAARYNNFCNWQELETFNLDYA